MGLAGRFFLALGSGRRRADRRASRGRSLWLDSPSGAPDPTYPWVDSDPQETPPDDGYYGATVFHAAFSAYPTMIPGWWADNVASRWIRTTQQQAYFHLGTEQWVYSGNREIHCRCKGTFFGVDNKTPWSLARTLGVLEDQGIYAVYDPDSAAYYWYVGDPTRPGWGVYAYCLAYTDSPPITDEGLVPWVEGSFRLHSELPAS